MPLEARHDVRVDVHTPEAVDHQFLWYRRRAAGCQAREPAHIVQARLYIDICENRVLAVL
jgi:hypothetical protein